MDIATLAGLVLGVVCLALGILGRGATPEAAIVFLSLPSALIVLGGTLAALFLAVPMRTAVNAPAVALKALLYRRASLTAVIDELAHYAEIARREGILALEGVAESTPDPFLARALGLAVDGTDPEQIREILSGELDAIESRHTAGSRCFDILAKYAPAWGLIGTLVGLILMLSRLESPSEIGHGMSLALVTTFYGAVLANFIFGPVAEKLRERSEEELLVKQMVLRGITAIQSGDNPRIVRQKLVSYLPRRGLA